MSAAWIVITVDDLDDYLVAAQMTALRTAALKGGQSDPFTNIMHERANYIQKRLTSRVAISATSYAVPPELKKCMCVLTIESMQGRLPLAMRDDFKEQVRRAYKDLDIAGTIEFPITEPLDPVPQGAQVGAPVEVVRSSTRYVTADTLNGF